MRKIRILALFALIGLVAGLGSCYFGLEPAWKKTGGKTTFRVDFSGASDSARAISDGTGYLYIRTVGGPTGDKGPAYGPYTVTTGGVFATTDIPAGTFEKFCILYSAIRLDTLAGFNEIFKLPDADFIAQAFTEDNEFEQIISGSASGHIVENFTVQEGVINTIDAVLIPMTGPLEVDLSASNVVSGLPVSEATVKKFIRLSNVNTAGNANLDTLVFTSTADTAYPAGLLSRVRLYDSEGKYLSLGIPDAMSPGSFKASFPGGTDFYAYVEYTGHPAVEITLTQGSVPAGNVVRLDVDLTALAGVAGKTFFCGLNLGEDSGPGGVGIVTIPASRVFSVYLMEPSAADTYWEYPAAGTYYLSAMVDMSDSYTGLTFPITEEEMSVIMPLNGDWATMDKSFPVTISGTGAQALPLDSGKFALSDEIQYFAAGATKVAAGNGSGTTPLNPVSLTEAFALAIGQNIVGDEKPAMIYLLEDVPLTSSIEIDASVGLISNGATRTITLGPDSGFTAPCFNIVANTGTDSYGLYVRNVMIDGDSVPNRSFSAISVGTSTHLMLENGAGVANVDTLMMLPNTGGVYGGAINATGGYVMLHEAVITGCSSDRGGAIYLGTDLVSGMGSSLELSASEISGNTAYQGGGIYSDTNSAIRVLEGSTVTGNGSATTEIGGGIYSMGYLAIPGADAAGDPNVTGNTAISDPNVSAASLDTAVHQMYVSQTGGGDGLTTENPTDIAAAFAASTVSDIVLVSDLTVDTSLAIPANRTVFIRSADDTGSLYSILPGTALTGPVFEIPTYAGLELERVNVGVASGTSFLPTLIRLGAQANLSLKGEATLRNNASAESGGAVQLLGGSMNLEGGSIVNCSAAEYGGAIYGEYDPVLYYQSNVNLKGGTIEACSASLAGGAIALRGGILNSYEETEVGDMPIALITNCSAPSGGAIYLEQYNDLGYTSDSMLYFNNPDRLVISTCEATTGSGGAIYASGTGTAINLNGATIGNNSAAGSGGAIYAVAGSSVSLSPSVTGNQTTPGSIEISGNEALHCGGIYMETGVTFTEPMSPDFGENYVFANVSSDGTTNDDIVRP